MYRKILVAYNGTPESRLALDEAIRFAPDASVEGHGLTVIDHLVVGEPVDVLTKLVTELGIDLLILGHPRSKSFALRWWRGSVDAVLIERVRCSVLVAADAPARGAR